MQRRDFLKTMFATAVGGTLFQHSISSAVAAPAPKTLVVIFQRGGCDGLNVVVPYAEDEYYRLRPNIAIAPAGSTNGALDLDGFFGLHPSMSALHNLYTDGNLAIFPAVHYPNASRSHFDSQQYIESAEVNRNADGWLNRHLASTVNSVGMRGVSFGSSIAHALQGPISVSSFSDLRRFDLDMEINAEQRLIDRLSAVYAQEGSSRSYSNLLRNSGRTLFSDLNTISSLDATNYQAANNAVYPDNSYGRQLAQTAQLIKAGTGLELATITLGGWDTHQNQGGAEGGMANRLTNFSDGIAAFYRDMGTQMSDVMLLTIISGKRKVVLNIPGFTPSVIKALISTFPLGDSKQTLSPFLIFLAAASCGLIHNTSSV
jgi:uncharacterized protein (DUF1501 family)